MRVSHNCVRRILISYDRDLVLGVLLDLVPPAPCAEVDSLSIVPGVVDW
jgi:hypothetical protein